MKRTFVVLIALLLAAALAWAKEKPKVVELKDAKGESVGTAAITPHGQGVAIKLELKNLPPGAYVMVVTFEAEPWVGSAPMRLRNEVRFRVRERTASEEVLLGETEQFATTAFDRARSGALLSELVSWSEKRLSADSADPFVPCVLLMGVKIAAARVPTPARQKNQLLELEIAVARRHDASPVGAVLADAEPFRSADPATQATALRDGPSLLRSVMESSQRMRVRQ